MKNTRSKKSRDTVPLTSESISSEIRRPPDLPEVNEGSRGESTEAERQSVVLIGVMPSLAGEEGECIIHLFVT
jgi:hypothetical protein